MKHLDDIETESAATTGLPRHDLRGILIPFTTPFNSNEELDAKGLRANIRRWNPTGVVGYIALGSTGERVHLSEREYLEVIEIAREEIPQDIAFIVGAGQQSTRGTISDTRRAAAAGADAVLVITPHFYRPAVTPEALAAHYTAVADASPVPVILYSMPDLTGIKIEGETAAQLSGHQNIIGIKDSSADIEKFRQTVELVPKDFAVLIGNGAVLYDALCAGARGGILAVGCVATTVCVEIYRLVQAGERNKAAGLQERLTPLALAVTKRYGIGGLKAAMDIVGFAGGAVRSPLKPASEDAQREIASLLAEIRLDEFPISDAAGDETRSAGVV